MIFKYQFIHLGDDHPLLNEIKKVFDIHISELGIKKDSIIFINRTNFHHVYKSNVPTVVLYFGNEKGDFKDINIVEILIKSVEIFLPIVNDLKMFTAHIPKQLEKINGFTLSNDSDIEKLVACILEGFGLLRHTRRLFISYKRDESSNVAIQLFEQFEKQGFDVFLDTHSVRPGEPFQDELWHRMSDTDIIVLLNSPGFSKSPWTTLELAQANTMTIGILQLIWPKQKIEQFARLSIPFKLKKKCFKYRLFDSSFSKRRLAQPTINTIVNMTESLRARSLAARQDNLISEFVKSSRIAGKSADLQPNKVIILKRKDGKNLAIIPTIGVPQAFSYHKSEELISSIKLNDVVGIWLLYDHLNIKEGWLNHLAWLDKHLPVKSIKIFDADKWLKTI